MTWRDVYQTGRGSRKRCHGRWEGTSARVEPALSISAWSLRSDRHPTRLKQNWGRGLMRHQKPSQEVQKAGGEPAHLGSFSASTVCPKVWRWRNSQSRGFLMAQSPLSALVRGPQGVEGSSVRHRPVARATKPRASKHGDPMI